MSITIGQQTIGAAAGVPPTRIVGGVDLSTDRTAAALKTSLAITAADVSGVGITTGTYATMTGLTPARGDRFFVTSGRRQGSLYECVSPGTWRRVTVDLGLGPGWMTFDAEDIPAQGAQTLRAWPSVDRNETARIPAGYNAPPITASSLGGMPCVAMSTTYLLVDGPNIGRGADKTIILVISGLSASGNNGLCAIGATGATANSVGIFGNFVGSAISNVCVEYDAGATSLYNCGTAIPADSAAHVIVWTWDSANATSRLYIDGSPAATPTQVPGSTRGVLDATSSFKFGCGRCNFTAAGVYNLHHGDIGGRRLSNAEVSAVSTLLLARFS